ncbi:MAG: S8 family serine peptidase [Bacteroidota bacterium]
MSLALTPQELDARIGFSAAWALGARGQGIGVAVLDTGVAPEHADSIDGYPTGFEAHHDFSGDDAPGRTPSVHAARMAAAVRRVAPEAPLLDGKVFPAEGRLRRRHVADALAFVLEAQPRYRVVNLSLWIPAGWWVFRCEPGDRCVACRAVNAAADAGLLVVAAAGNTGGVVECPGAAERALTVGATETAAQRAHYEAGGTYGEWTGTSFSAALVSGCAAAAWSVRPEATADEVRAALIASARPLAGEPESHQGAGVVHAGRAAHLLASGGV